MVFHLLLAVMLATGPDYTVSGPFASAEECKAMARLIVSSYPPGAVRAVGGHCIPGHTA